MKKTIVFFLISIIFLSLFACSSQNVEKELAPESRKIVNILELATLETYYHNVSKLEKEAGTGIKHWFEKDKKMWIEYTGKATLGIDLEETNIEINGQEIIISMPKATVLQMEVDEDSLNENSYYSSPDGINKNLITAEEQTLMIKNAQENMRDRILNDTSLLNKAELRAKELIENYINQITNITDTEYTIEWNIIEASEDK
ncbi:MAG: DUF4230 domain-containing protein [Clostridiaceae bacterium]|nr:DUF4230 domain-containing protein [Clostridiaceae bacterium]